MMRSHLTPQESKVKSFSNSDLLKSLNEQLAYCRDNSTLYADEFEASGLKLPLASLDGFYDSEFSTDKEFERASEASSLETQGHPYGLHVCAAVDELRGISATSGTSGLPTFTYLFTSSDLDRLDETWARLAKWVGLTEGDQVLHLMGLSMWVLGTLAARSLTNVGLGVLPVGAEVGTERAIMIARRCRPKGVVATPTQLESIVRKCEENDISPASLGIQKAICVGEPGAGIPAVRRRLETALNAEIYDAMVGGWGAAQISCQTDPDGGMHVLSPEYLHWEAYDESSRYESDDLIREGRGLVTSLQHRARPIVRFDMGDRVRIDRRPCACGHSSFRVKILGRADDMLIVNGVNLYPASVKDLAAGVPGTTGRMYMEIKDEDGRISGRPRLVVEAEEGALHSQLEELIRQKIKTHLRVGMEVVAVRTPDFQPAIGPTGKTQLLKKV